MWREVEPDVFYADSTPVLATEVDLKLLESKASVSQRGRARLCAHASPTDRQHEMLICLTRRGYIRPHRHFKPESALVIRGACDLVMFEEQGDICEVLRLGDSNSGDPFFVRIPEGIYHTYVLRSEFLFFLETTPGPFDRRMSQFAPWSPEESGPVESFQRELAGRIARHGGSD